MSILQAYFLILFYTFTDDDLCVCSWSVLYWYDTSLSNFFFFFFEWIVTCVVLNDAVFWEMTLCDWWKYRTFRKRSFLLFIVILYFAKNDVTQFNCYTWNNFVGSLSFAPCVFISHLFHTHIETLQLWFERFFHSRTMHPDIIESFIYTTECTNRLKFALKCSYMFRLTNHHQGPYYCALLKLCLLTL